MNSFVRPWLIAFLLLGGLIAIGSQLLKLNAETDRVPPSDTAFSLNDFLSSASSGASGFTKAKRGTLLNFPEDHLAHPGYRSEWWYLNGNLWHADDLELRYGFQFTIFRQALQASADAKSDWLQPQFYMGHIALTDYQTEQHMYAERLTRQGPGLAGTQAQSLLVWLESWSLQALSSAALFPAQLIAGDPQGRFSYRLTITPEKPLVLQGDNGYSPKRREPGFASFYYSYTRLNITGEMMVGSKMIPVNGVAWYDHEWSSNSLAAYQVGWDWFSLQLDDGRELMFMLLRSEDGQRDFRQVSLIDHSGGRLPLEPSEVELLTTGQWQAPEGGLYPSGWQIKVPRYGLDLVVLPRIPDQENRLSVRYWEGAVSVTGSHQGQGYVELTGY